MKDATSRENSTSDRWIVLQVCDSQALSIQDSKWSLPENGEPARAFTTWVWGTPTLARRLPRRLFVAVGLDRLIAPPSPAGCTQKHYTNTTIKKEKEQVFR